MLAGAAGGVGAIFRAPLGGALFAGEVLYSSTAFESAALLPCLASSIVAYSTFALFITPQPIFSLPEMSFRGLRELPLFVVLTLLCAGRGLALRARFLRAPRSVLQAAADPEASQAGRGWPVAGNLGPGVSASDDRRLWLGAMGRDRHAAMRSRRPGETSFVPHMGVTVLLTLALLKIVATGLTISSGGSGGVFGPSMLIGGMLGGACGQFLD